MKKTRSQPSKRLRIADRLHSVAIHLLRRVREEDPQSGLTPARLSALSVVVYAGPIRLTDLADAEQVRPPTMTRLVQGLESEGLVQRRASSEDARASYIEATVRGKQLFEKGRQRRLAKIDSILESMSWRELSSLDSVVRRLSEVIHEQAEVNRNSRA